MVHVMPDTLTTSDHHFMRLRYASIYERTHCLCVPRWQVAMEVNYGAGVALAGQCTSIKFRVTTSSTRLLQLTIADG
jgi:hypothetical protein